MTSLLLECHLITAIDNEPNKVNRQKIKYKELHLHAISGQYSDPKH